MFRGGVVGLICSRSLELKDGVQDDARAVTMMSTYVDLITDKIQLLHNLWAQSIEVIIGFWMLSELGWASIAPVPLILVSSIVTAECGKLLGQRQKALMEAR